MISHRQADFQEFMRQKRMNKYPIEVHLRFWIHPGGIMYFLGDKIAVKGNEDLDVNQMKIELHDVITKVLGDSIYEDYAFKPLNSKDWISRWGTTDPAEIIRSFEGIMDVMETEVDVDYDNAHYVIIPGTMSVQQQAVANDIYAMIFKMEQK